MGYTYLYYGTGAGKTTNALGLALRELGHEQRVVIIQFMKANKDTGEVQIKNKLGQLSKNYIIHQVGRTSWIDFKNPAKEDIAEVERGLELAKQAISSEPDLLVLDELALAAWGKLVHVDKIIELLNSAKASPKTHVVITGRYAPQELIEQADFVNEIKEVRYPKEMTSVKGINW